MAKERKRLIYVDQPPEGLIYIPRFLSHDEEQELIAHASAQSFEPYDHHGYKANREVAYFGTRGYGIGDDNKRKPVPDWLLPVRERIANLAGLNIEELEMVLVARYDVGAGIGWHRDRPQFGPTVFGVSLASDAEMRLRRFIGEAEEMFKINLQHGSAYIMSGPARSVWQHGMNPVKQLRYSITMRTIKDKRNRSDAPRHQPEEILKRLNAKKIKFGIEHHAENDEPKQLKLTI